jgi:signal transduction protein with GAF and PtsI domain
VDSVKTSLEIKGCALFLIDPQNKALEVAASCGLSAEYLKKGPLSSMSDDPRIQYPDAAKKEGIASILAVPIYSRGNVIGSMRVYSAEQWEFTLEDVNFVQAAWLKSPGSSSICADSIRGKKNLTKF